MSTRVDRALPQGDREAIRQAVAETELRTSAEIVVCVVARSADYVAARWRAAVWFGFVGALVPLIASAYRSWRDPAHFEVYSPVSLLPMLVGAGLGALLVHSVSWLRRRFVPPEVRARNVRFAAERAFLKEEVFATVGRTGVLIFVSLFEHIVCILPDSAVRETVPESAWQGVSDRIAAGIAAGRLGESLCEGVALTGALLGEHGPVRGENDHNELADDVRGG